MTRSSRTGVVSLDYGDGDVTAAKMIGDRGTNNPRANNDDP